MTNMDNVVALNATPTAIVARTHRDRGEQPMVRMTRDFRKLMDAPTSAAEFALLRMVVSDVQSGVLTGCVTWSLDDICKTVLLRQWPSGRIIDIVPFPVGKLRRDRRALRFAARINTEIATIGIADDPDPTMTTIDGHAIGSRIGAFP